MIDGISMEDISKEYSRLSREVGELSEAVRCGVNPVEPDQVVVDYAGVLGLGWEWLFQRARDSQPRFYSELYAAEPYLIVGERFWPDRVDGSRVHWLADMFLSVGDRFFVVYPEFSGSYVEKEQGRHRCYSRFLSLPKAIAEAYYFRMDGLQFVSSLPPDRFSSRVLPVRLSAWAPVGSICRNTARSMALMTDALGGVADPVLGGSLKVDQDFRVILDTRGVDEEGVRGDFLVVQESSQSGRIFHLSDGDFSTLRVVESAVELVDDYVAHVLRGEAGSFSFSDYR